MEGESERKEERGVRNRMRGGRETETRSPGVNSLFF